MHLSGTGIYLCNFKTKTSGLFFSAVQWSVSMCQRDKHFGLKDLHTSKHLGEKNTIFTGGNSKVDDAMTNGQLMLPDPLV